MAADLTTFGGRLFYARSERTRDLGRTVSQTAVAAVAGVVPNAVSKWEAGAGPPDVDTIGKIAVFLGVEPGWLAFGRGEMRPPTVLRLQVAEPDALPAYLPPMTPMLPPPSELLRRAAVKKAAKKAARKKKGNDR